MNTDPAKGSGTLIFRSEVRPQLYLASGALVVVGGIFVAYGVSTADPWPLVALGTGVGVFMLFVAWITFRATRAGYPHLILGGGRLLVLSSDVVQRAIDPRAHGTGELRSVYSRRTGKQLYLCFPPGPDGVAQRNWLVPPGLSGYAALVLLNGFVGQDVAKAQEIVDTVNAHRDDGGAVPADLPPRDAARLRLVATAVAFALAWGALLWWRLAS